MLECVSVREDPKLRCCGVAIDEMDTQLCIKHAWKIERIQIVNYT